MRKHINRIISITLAAAMSVSMISSISASAEEITAFPYTLFAASETEGAITTTAGNFCVNGNVCTNGTIVTGGNINVNGTKTENAGQDMIYIFDKIDTKYFSGNNVEEHTEDYVLDELNININTPTEVLGEAELTGNININTALKAFEDVSLNGEVKNTNDSVIYSKYGDIVIDSTNVNLNGLVYAPFGDVVITAQNLNLNNVVIIADSITFDCPSVNSNYSSSVADFVGTVSEPLNIPKDEWQYMKDENENGLPDFFEDFDNWSKLADTDGDGLPDSIEEYLGSDVNNTDTDGDGLGDYYEVFVTYTDPTMADTDENGVNDGDEDFDEDGLTNLEEFLNNTYPYIDDSDNDGLSDGDEVNKYETDPLVADTDGDGLDDGDEITLGTNPLVQDTDGDGIIDSKEKFQQTYTHKVKNEDCAVTEVIVDMECTGNINKTTSVESVMNTDILCTDVVGLVGEPFEIETTSEFNTATLTFTIDKSKLGETEFDNLLFLWYNEEENDFVEIETTLDEENSTASITTTHFSKYMVIDKYKWFEAWAVEFDYNPTGGGSGAPTVPVKYNTVLAIDCSGSMGWNDHISIKSGINSAYDALHPYTCNRITAAEGFIRYMNSNDETAIVLFTDRANTASSMTTDKETLKLALQKMYSNGGTSFSAALNASIKQIESAEKISNGANKNRIILLSDGDDNDSASSRNAAIQMCNDKYIEVYTVGFGSANDTILQNIADKTGGKYYKALESKDIVDIFAKFGYMDDFDMTDTDGDGLPDAVETAGIRLQNGIILRDVDSSGLIFTDPTNPDTDGDGLLDGEEIDPTPCVKTVPVIERDPSFCGPVLTQSSYYFKANSDPRKKDSDGDGYADGPIDSLTNGKFNDPRRLLCDVKTVELRNLYTIVDTSSYSSLENYNFGGNQNWFYDENDDNKNDIESKHICYGGCGVIASCDVILYLQKCLGIKLVDVDTSSITVSFEEYDRFVRLYAKDYLTPLDVETPILDGVTEDDLKKRRPMFLTPWESEFYDVIDKHRYESYQNYAQLFVDTITAKTGTWGCDPSSLQTAFEKYCLDNKLSVNAEYCFASPTYSQKSLEERIINTISKDIPAIMMIGLLQSTEYRYDCNSKDIMSTSSHFVVITGINIDNITQKTTLTVSTWSHKAYIELDNYLDNSGLLGGILFLQIR